MKTCRTASSGRCRGHHFLDEIFNFKSTMALLIVSENYNSWIVYFYKLLYSNYNLVFKSTLLYLCISYNSAYFSWFFILLTKFFFNTQHCTQYTFYNKSILECFLLVICIHLIIHIHISKLLKLKYNSIKWKNPLWNLFPAHLKSIQWILIHK